MRRDSERSGGVNELHLFAGAGGGILGGMLLGHTCVCAVEIEPYCRKVLLQRQRDGILPKFPIWDDVRTFDGKPWRGKVDVVCGGFPCQDISCAGKGAGIDGERSGLWSDFARIISEVRPRYAFVENSPMLAVRGLGRVLGDLSESGYDAEWLVMGADDVGAPHRRKRIWILAHARHGCGRGDFRRKSRRLCGGENESIGKCNTNQALRPSPTPATMADADCLRQQQPQGFDKDFGRRFGDGGFDVSDAEMSGRGRGVVRPPKGQLGRGDTRSIPQWWRHDPADDESAAESRLGRVAYGVADRVDRLKALGNGQVPVVAARAFVELKRRLLKL